MAAAKIYVDHYGIDHWIGVSSDTKPIATTVPTGSTFYETDTLDVFRVSASGAWTRMPVGVTLLGGAGVRNPTSASNNHLASIPECTLSIVSTFGSDQTVTASPAKLIAIAGGNGVVNGSQVILKDGGTTLSTYPAGTIPVAGKDCRGAKMNTSIIVNITTASGTNLEVYWVAQ